MISQTLDAYRAFDPFGVGLSGDPKRAKVLLQQSGLTSPVPLRVVYRKGILRDRAMGALKARWEQAGFTVTLIPLDSRYTTTVNQAAYASRADVFWGLWEADFGSALTMIPPLFDGRVNLSAAGSGQDLGYVNNPALNARMDAAARLRTTPHGHGRGATSTRPSPAWPVPSPWSTSAPCSCTGPPSRTTATMSCWAGPSTWPRSLCDDRC